jgi:two-component system, sensor histidine kinase and response regulator
MNKILVIEDEKELRDTLVEYLELSDYTVDHASNGISAYNMIHNKNYDLILSDVNLPRMNGFELLQKLNEEQDKKYIPPYLFISALSKPTDVINGLKLGADDYITKPFDFNNLIEKIQDKIEKRGQLSKSIIQEERKRISGELHDNLQQLLVASIMGIETTQNNIEGKNADVLKSTKSFMNEAIVEIQRIVSDLSKQSDHENFKGLINELTTKLSITSGLKINTQISINNVLSKKISNHLFCVIQECITNILKYAKASSINLSIEHHKSELTLLIEDDGIGFDLENTKLGNGMKNIQDRIHSIDGTIIIITSPEQGTKIDIGIPLEKEHFVNNNIVLESN